MEADIDRELLIIVKEISLKKWLLENCSNLEMIRVVKLNGAIALEKVKDKKIYEIKI